MNKAESEKDKVKSEKLTKKAAYLQELDSPGSTKLNADYLGRKRLKNIAAAVAAGREAVGDLVVLGAVVATVPQAIAAVGSQYTAAVVATAIPYAAVAAGVGVGATKLTVDSIKRIKAINEDIDKRETKA